MSTVRANTWETTAGAQSVNSAAFAKVWFNLNGTGTIAERDSYNVTSYVDNGTGLYTANFTNNMADANYAVTGGGNTPGTATTTVISPASASGNQTASSLRVGGNRVDTGAAIDVSFANAAIHGSLA